MKEVVNRDEVTPLREAAQQALVTLHQAKAWHPAPYHKLFVERRLLATIEKLTAALEAQPAQQAGEFDKFRAMAEAARIESIHDLPVLIPALQATEPEQQSGPVDDFGRPIVYDTEAVDAVTHALTGDEGEDDSVTVLQGLARYVQNVWPGKSAQQVLMEYEELLMAAPQPPAQGEPGPLPVRHDEQPDYCKSCGGSGTIPEQVGSGPDAYTEDTGRCPGCLGSCVGPLADGWQISVANGHEGYGVYAHLTEYPEEGAVLLLSLAAQGFEAMRKQIKKPMTLRAATLILKELQTLKDAGHDPNACLDQSTVHCWLDVYAPKKKDVQVTSVANADQELARIREQERRAVKPPPEVLERLRGLRH